MLVTNAINSTPASTAIEQARFNMIEQQIRPWDVLDSQVLAVLAHNKREHFVAPEHQGLAFSDTELPLGQGQFMLCPKLEARLLQTTAVKASDRVLEIGTGSGYMAALLGFTAAQVYTFETLADLVPQAQKRLHTALLDNVYVTHGCGFVGGVGQAGERGWDLIVLSGSVPSLDSIPVALKNTLTIGGRLVAIVGNAQHSPMMQAMRITRNSNQASSQGSADTPSFSTEILFDCNAPALSGVAASAFVF
jgi:protein-L-isoaspartate(D-aspartate) O-methyltransferase